VLFTACIPNRAGIFILLPFSIHVLPTNVQVTGDLQMILAMINCHDNVYMVAQKLARTLSARLQPQLQHFIDWLVGPANFLLPILVVAGPWLVVLKTKGLLYLVLRREHHQAQFCLETATELFHL
jgi:hypothetical protein